jgi:hypothetical protein
MSAENLTDRKRIIFLVYIIESPSPVDLYHNTYEGEILSKALSLAGIPSIHRLAVNLEAFIASLTIGLQEYLKQSDSLPPILHISAHGSSEGIQLTSGEVVNWNKLKELIMPINKALKGNLILCMSSCEGSNACRMAMSEDDIPFLGIVGHSGKPTWSDTAIGFATFYHLLSKGYYVREAVEAMKTASGDNGFQEIQGKIAREIYIDAIKKIRRQSLLEELRKITPKVPESPLSKALREIK